MKRTLFETQTNRSTSTTLADGCTFVLTILAMLLTGQIQAQTLSSPEELFNEVEEMHHTADSLYASGNFDKAIPLYLEVTRRDPGKLAFYEPLAYSYAKIGLFDEAEKWLIKRQKYSNDPTMDQCFLADLAARRTDLKAVQNHTDSLRTLAGSDTKWTITACIAEMEAHLGEFGQAKVRLENAVTEMRRQEKPLHGLSFLAFLELQEENTARAEKLLMEHEALAKKKLSEGRHIAVSHFDLAIIGALGGEAEMAIAHIDEGLRHGGWGQYWGGYYYIMADPIFKSLHGYLIFEQYMKEIKKGVDRMRKNVKGLKEESEYVVDIIAADYAFGMPSEIPSGWVTFRMENMGHGMHLAMLGGRPDTLAKKDFLKAINEGTWPPFEYAGGPGIHSPGTTSETTIFMKPGDYFIGCGAYTEDGKNHSAMGMIRYLKVTEEPSGATEPIADAVLVLDKFEINADLFSTSGTKTVKVEHNAHPMDVHLIRLDEKSTIPKAVSYFHELRDPPPVNLLGGVEQAETGSVSYVTLDFEPGEYVWMSHEYGAWGMQLPFTIPNSGRVTERTGGVEEAVNNVSLKVGSSNLQVADKIAPGKSKLLFESAGEEEHDLEINRLKPKATKQEAIEWYDAWVDQSKDDIEEYPFLGYWITVDLVKENQIVLDLIPDRYFIHCKSIDEEGIRHWHKGEAAVFTVPDVKGHQ